MRATIAFLCAIGLTAQASAEISEHDRDSYCRLYADQAVKAYEDKLKYGCTGFQGPEWDPKFGAHYGWCMRLSGDPRNAADNQTYLRAAMISSCYCHYYAREAVKAAKENRSLGCGFTGARWIDSHAAHNNWCRGLPSNSRAHIDEAQARSQDLQRCKREKIQQGARTSPGEASPCAAGWTPWTYQGQSGCCPPGERYFAWGDSRGCAKAAD